MAMNIYKWGGHTYQIDEKDLGCYPGAVPVKGEKKAEPKTKKKAPAKNKSHRSQNK